MERVQDFLERRPELVADLQPTVQEVFRAVGCCPFWMNKGSGECQPACLARSVS